MKKVERKWANSFSRNMMTDASRLTPAGLQRKGGIS